MGTSRLRCVLMRVSVAWNGPGPGPDQARAPPSRIPRNARPSPPRSLPRYPREPRSATVPEGKAGAIGGAAKLRLRILPMAASSGTARTAAGVRQFTGNTLATKQQGL